MVLCTYCSGFVSCIGKEYIGEYFLHQPSFKALLRSIDDCELCKLVANAFHKTNQAESILEEAENGYPNTLTFVGVDQNDPWKYYPMYQDKRRWEALVGILVNCGEPGRNDDWACHIRLFTDHGK
jgi:hypothetical protein